MQNRNLLIASTSTVHGQPYLEYLSSEIEDHFSSSEEILFIPFARPGGMSWDQYTDIARGFFESKGIKIKSIHEKDQFLENLEECNGIFTGGGNTFVLLKSLYDLDLVPGLRQKIAEGIPYLGTSAGSNILGSTIRTTNDMPIVYPPSFKALGAIPFNINPHYIDPDPKSKHMGETRETRIKEFHFFNDTPVVGLREGSYFKVNHSNIKLGGSLSARVFEKGKKPYELQPGENFSFLMVD